MLIGVLKQIQNYCLYILPHIMSFENLVLPQLVNPSKICHQYYIRTLEICFCIDTSNIPLIHITFCYVLHFICYGVLQHASCITEGIYS